VFMSRWEWAVPFVLPFVSWISDIDDVVVWSLLGSLTLRLMVSLSSWSLLMLSTADAGCAAEGSLEPLSSLVACSIHRQQCADPGGRTAGSDWKSDECNVRYR
jgi:hypothetical protein